MSFETIPGITLSHLADLSEETRMSEGESLILDEKSNNSFYVIVTGSVDFYKQGMAVSAYSRGNSSGR